MPVVPFGQCARPDDEVGAPLVAVSAFALRLHEPWVAGTIGGGTIAPVVGAFRFPWVTGRTAPVPKSPPGR